MQGPDGLRLWGGPEAMLPATAAAARGDKTQPSILETEQAWTPAGIWLSLQGDFMGSPRWRCQLGAAAATFPGKSERLQQQETNTDER